MIGDGGEGEDLPGGAGNKVVEEDAEDEEERVEQLDRGVEFGAFFKGEGRIDGDEEVRGFSARELAEAAAGLAEAGDKFFFGQSGERAEGEDAPAGEGFCVVGREGKDGERERGEGSGFLTDGNDGGGPSGKG